MDKNEVNEDINVLDKIYNIRQEILGELTIDIKEKLNSVSIEELQILIEKNIENIEARNKVLKKIDLLIENYEIRMANYIEKSYKQGFKDAFNLYNECLKK